MNDKTLNADADIDDEFELTVKPQILDETKVSLDSLIRTKSFFPYNPVKSLCANINSTEVSEMSLTNIVGDSKLTSNQTVVSIQNPKLVGEVSRSLNFTSDMSMTEMIETDNANTTLKIEFDEELANFLPTSASSRLQESTNESSMQLVPFNQEAYSNKENIPTAGNGSILKSALSTGGKGQAEIKEKKALRFTADTRDPKEGLLKRLKDQQKKYPVLFISSKPSN